MHSRAYHIHYEQERSLMPRWHLPIIDQLSNYSVRLLRADVIAALALLTVSIPLAIAYAQLAGVPPEAGFYAAPVALIGFALFSSSRQTVVGPSSTVALVSAAIIMPLAAGGSERYLVLTAALAIIAGVIFLISGLARLGFIANFMSNTVITGFIFGLVMFIMLRQVPKLFGVEGADGNFFQMAWQTANNLGATHGWTIMVGSTSLAMLLILERFARKVPAAIVVLIYGILLVSFLRLDLQGVEVMGYIPSALPQFNMPDIQYGDVLTLLPGAFGLVFIGFAETISIGRNFASKHHYEVDANRELIGLGVANMGTGLFSGFTVDASMGQSSTMDRGGAKTQLAALIAAGFVLIITSSLTFLFQNLPQATLGAIVIYAVYHSLRYKELKRIYSINRFDFALAMVALFGVLAFNLMLGLLIAVVGSLLAITLKASMPHTAILGKVPNQDTYSDIKRNPNNQAIDGMIIVRPDAPIFFANANRIREEIMSLVHSSKTPTKVVVIDLESTDELDLPSLDMLSELKSRLDDLKVGLNLARVHGSVRRFLQRSSLLDKIGEENIYAHVDQAVYAFSKKYR
jgi:high affinity sulfate transporter 1